MESKKPRSEPRWTIILEEMRFQNRVTLEAVESSRTALEERMDRAEQKSEARFTVIEAAIRSTAKNGAALESRMSSLERTLELSDQENRARFAALEAALQRMDLESRSRDASLELAIRDVKVNVQQNSVDLRDLAIKVDALSNIEARVAALEVLRPAKPAAVLDPSL
jgi:hypothetical protein